MPKQTLTQRLDALRRRYAVAAAARKSTHHLQREMVMLVVKQIKRELREERCAQPSR